METGLPRCPWGDSALGEGLLSLRGQERASPTDELVPLPRLSHWGLRPALVWAQVPGVLAPLPLHLYPECL